MYNVSYNVSSSVLRATALAYSLGSHNRRFAVASTDLSGPTGGRVSASLDTSLMAELAPKPSEAAEKKATPSVSDKIRAHLQKFGQGDDFGTKGYWDSFYTE